MIVAKALRAVLNDASPTLFWDFRRQSLTDFAGNITASFSRGSGATQYDSSGYMSWAPENLFKDSAGPTTANWSNANVTVTANALGDYTLVAETVTNAVHQISQTVVTGIPGVGETFTVTADVISYGGRDLYIGSNASVFGVNDFCYYDITNGTVRLAASSVIQPSITSLGGGAYRVKWSGIVITSAQSPAFFIASVRTTDTIRGPTFAGDPTKGFYIRNVQVQRGIAATPYVATTNAAYYGPAFDYNPTQAYKENSNLFLYSEDQTNGFYSKTGVTLQSYNVNLPDGVTAGFKLAEDTSTGLHRVFGTSVNVDSGKYYTARVRVRAGERTIAFIQIGTGALWNGGNPGLYLDLTTGVVSGFNGVSYTRTLGNDGWWTVTITGFCVLTGTSGGLIVHNVLTGSTTSYAGTSGWGLYVAGFQMNEGFSSSAYVKTTASAAAGAYVAPSRGLAIWEQRSNLLTYSQEYANAAWPKTDITATSLTTDVNCPSGLNCATKIVEGSAGTAIMSSPISVITAGNFCVGSHYIKRGNFDWIRIRISEDGTATDGNVVWFNLGTGQYGTATAQGAGSNNEVGVQLLPNGWYRVWIACNVNSTSTNIRLFISSASANGSTVRVAGATYYVAGSQFESFTPSVANASTARMSPYMPTSNAGVTRNADVTTVSSVTAVLASAGAISAQFESSYLNSNGSARAIGIYLDDGTASNRHYIFANSGGANMSAGTSASAAALANLSYTAAPINIKNVVYAFAPSNMYGYYAGASMGTSTTAGSMPVINRIMLGHRTVDYLNGWLRTASYYNHARPTAIAQRDSLR